MFSSYLDEIPTFRDPSKYIPLLRQSEPSPSLHVGNADRGALSRLQHLRVLVLRVKHAPNWASNGHVFFLGGGLPLVV